MTRFSDHKKLKNQKKFDDSGMYYTFQLSHPPENGYFWPFSFTQSQGIVQSATLFLFWNILLSKALSKYEGSKICDCLSNTSSEKKSMAPCICKIIHKKVFFKTFA